MKSVPSPIPSVVPRSPHTKPRRIEQAGGQLISKTQLWCELQRDWNRADTVPGFMYVLENADGLNPEKDFM